MNRKRVEIKAKASYFTHCKNTFVIIIAGTRYTTNNVFSISKNGVLLVKRGHVSRKCKPLDIFKFKTGLTDKDIFMKTEITAHKRRKLNRSKRHFFGRCDRRLRKNIFLNMDGGVV